eukprot:TRINITY_DN11770_c0_g1_i1.p1 TRINITY_DN11770_c0_g1~~TRINITY_DN11770_c0_g1_i1.p1  ORF type:complete len:957 (+),score=204.65 TRINITY_DN11770_c0_g1_i1:43-2913(+)
MLAWPPASAVGTALPESLTRATSHPGVARGLAGWPSDPLLQHDSSDFAESGHDCTATYSSRSPESRAYSGGTPSSQGTGQTPSSRGYGRGQLGEADLGAGGASPMSLLLDGLPALPGGDGRGRLFNVADLHNLQLTAKLLLAAPADAASSSAARASAHAEAASALQPSNTEMSPWLVPAAHLARSEPLAGGQAPLRRPPPPAPPRANAWLTKHPILGCGAPPAAAVMAASGAVSARGAPSVGSPPVEESVMASAMREMSRLCATPPAAASSPAGSPQNLLSESAAGLAAPVTPSRDGGLAWSDQGAAMATCPLGMMSPLDAASSRLTTAAASPDGVQDNELLALVRELVAGERRRHEAVNAPAKASLAAPPPLPHQGVHATAASPPATPLPAKASVPAVAVPPPAPAAPAQPPKDPGTPDPWGANKAAVASSSASAAEALAQGNAAVQRAVAAAERAAAAAEGAERAAASAAEAVTSAAVAAKAASTSAEKVAAMPPPAHAQPATPISPPASDEPGGSSPAASDLAAAVPAAAKAVAVKAASKGVASASPPEAPAEVEAAAARAKSVAAPCLCDAEAQTLDSVDERAEERSAVAAAAREGDGESAPPPVIQGGALRALSGQEVWIDLSDGAIDGAALWLSQRPPKAARSYLHAFDICLPWAAEAAAFYEPPGASAAGASSAAGGVGVSPLSPSRLSQGSPMARRRPRSHVSSPLGSPERDVAHASDSDHAYDDASFVEEDEEASEGEPTPEKVLRRINGLMAEMTEMESSLEHLRTELHTADVVADSARARPFSKNSLEAITRASLEAAGALPRRPPGRLRQRLPEAMETLADATADSASAVQGGAAAAGAQRSTSASGFEPRSQLRRSEDDWPGAAAAALRSGRRGTGSRGPARGGSSSSSRQFAESAIGGGPPPRSAQGRGSKSAGPRCRPQHPPWDDDTRLPGANANRVRRYR